LTHQELADVLGTVREIVTRLVRQFVEQHMVSSERGHIRVIDSAALSLVATQSN
jgi:CRP/FNR family transcriptional regulator